MTTAPFDRSDRKDDHPNPSDRRDSLVVALLVGLGIVAYSAWGLEVVLPTGLAPGRTYASELAAQDQPFGGLFRTTDLVAGVLMCAGGLWALLRLSPGDRWGTVGWTAVVLFGVATAVDSRLPLSCTPTVDRLCAQREHAGLVPVTHTAHATSSALAVCAVLVAMPALTHAARRHAPASSLARLGRPLVALELAATAWTLAAVAAQEAGLGNWSLGIAQRLQLALMAAWFATLALSVLRHRRPAPEPPAPAPRPPLAPETERAAR
ncbi:DUF998 domain-containing protein [Streptomyces sp. NPDC002952]|uniref:DUF998 domain-containing protein n=1 Tax=Streptomyces sp. NPDC002952 TaxID=3364673 RepID=UPI0036B4C79A